MIKGLYGISSVAWMAVTFLNYTSGKPMILVCVNASACVTSVLAALSFEWSEHDD